MYDRHLDVIFDIQDGVPQEQPTHELDDVFDTESNVSYGVTGVRDHPLQLQAEASYDYADNIYY